MDYTIYLLNPDNAGRIVVGTMHGAPDDKASHAFAVAFGAWLTKYQRNRTANCGYEAEPIIKSSVALFEKAPTEHTIRVIVLGGVVQDVEQLPMGFDYEVQDFDNCSDCGGIEPLCDWCKEAIEWEESRKPNTESSSLPSRS